MIPWCLGNTTIRSPFRLRELLVALSTSPLRAPFRGPEQDLALWNLLHEHDLLRPGGERVKGLGLKWRSALNKIGFLYPKVPAVLWIPQDEIGPLDTITPNGWRLIRAENVPAMEECVLRALAAYSLPSPLQPTYPSRPFSPLRHALAIMHRLDRQTGESRLDVLEMAVIVQCTNSDDDPQDIVAQILRLRERRAASYDLRRFESRELREAAERHGRTRRTLTDYADTNVRYLKATGLVRGEAWELLLTPEERVVIDKLVHDTGIPRSDRAYIVALCDGAALPTDDRDTGLEALDDLTRELDGRGIRVEPIDRPLATVAAITRARHATEERLWNDNETRYAKRQAGQWREIAEYMDLIIKRRRFPTRSKSWRIEVPPTEAPAYFEWAVWRAFLAIDSLRNKPHEARRFMIDRDCKPVGTAPGGGPDLILEFRDFVLAVEVTLTERSRQEAREGEPVRRHVADLVAIYRQRSGGPVYGLFIAKRVDDNTAETFRTAVWYNGERNRIELSIVPMTLAKFKDYFTALFSGQPRPRPIQVDWIRQLLDQCCDLRSTHEGPGWKDQIEQLIDQHIAQFTP